MSILLKCSNCGEAWVDYFNYRDFNIDDKIVFTKCIECNEIVEHEVIELETVSP